MESMKIPCGNGVLSIYFNTAALDTDHSITCSCRRVNTQHYSPFPKGILNLKSLNLKSLNK